MKEEKPKIYEEVGEGVVCDPHFDVQGIDKKQTATFVGHGVDPQEAPKSTGVGVSEEKEDNPGGEE